MTYSDSKYAPRRLIQHLAEVYPGGWTQLMKDSDINTLTAQGWRYGPKGSNPSGRYLVLALRAAGLLDEEFLPVQWDMEAGLQAADEAAAQGLKLSKRLPGERQQPEAK